MYFEQFYLGCLAHASYLLASEGEAVVVDPQRDVDIYLRAAEQHGLRIHHIFETHLHADFVSGHRELAAPPEPRFTSVPMDVPQFPTQRCTKVSSCAWETCESKFWKRLGTPRRASA